MKRISLLSMVLCIATFCFLTLRSVGESPNGERVQRGDADRPENMLALPGDIYCGAQPEGDTHFQTLAAMGVCTVVSVDGAVPDVATAEANGLRYVHIPIGYDGVDHEAGLALTRLVREADGPIYVHCHHGHHRGPAAAAVACIAGGFADNEAATKILQRAGTSESYAGLWRDVAAYVPPAEDAKLPELVSVAPVKSFVTAMANTGLAMERLLLCRAAGWKAPEDHPDLDPVQIALLVREGMQESTRHLDADADEELQRLMESSRAIAIRLHESLKVNRLADADVMIGELQTSCKQCHRDYRN